MERIVFDWRQIVAGDLSQRVDLSSFTHLRLYHCCRPVSVDSYYAQGIRVFPLTELAERFREIYSDLPPAAVQAAIGALKREPREERVDAVLDLRYLIKNATIWCKAARR